MIIYTYIWVRTIACIAGRIRLYYMAILSSMYEYLQYGDGGTVVDT